MRRVDETNPNPNPNPNWQVRRVDETGEEVHVGDAATLAAACALRKRFARMTAGEARERESERQWETRSDRTVSQN